MEFHSSGIDFFPDNLHTFADNCGVLMINIVRHFSSVVVISSIFVLCSCQPRVDLRGNITLHEKYDGFVEGKTTCSDVLSVCGSPSLQRGHVWIYIGHKSEEISFHKPELKERIIVRLTFDQNGLLKSKEKMDTNHLPDMPMDDGVTTIVNDAEISATMLDYSKDSRDSGDDRKQRQ